MDKLVLRISLTIAILSGLLSKASAQNSELWGTTEEGGANNVGVLFRFDPSSGTYQKLINFEDASLGSGPSSQLTYYKGKIYGTCRTGGANGDGTLFEYDIATGIATKKVDFDFWNLGIYPTGALVPKDGKLYGVTVGGGGANYGAIFEYDPTTGSATKRYAFDANGGQPLGGMALYQNKFYGATMVGGANGDGSLFEWDPVANTCIHKMSLDAPITGKEPFGLVLYKNKFYGLQNRGGAKDKGTLFEWDPIANIYTKKLDFDGSLYGSLPSGVLTLYKDKLYGVTFTGGTFNWGILFEWDPSTNIHKKMMDFNMGTPGLYVHNSPIVWKGKLYGITGTGGVNDQGTIYSINTSGQGYTKEWDFNAPDGKSPYAQLLEVGGNYPPVVIQNPTTLSSCLENLSFKFSVTDENKDTLSFTATSSNTNLLRDQDISVSKIGGDNYRANCTIVTGQTGSTTITITASDGHGGTDDFQVVVNIYKITTSVINKHDVSCNGMKDGGATMFAQGGQGGYTYNWNSSPVQNTATLSNVTGGIYTCRVADTAGCQAADSVQIIEPDTLKASIATQKNVSCNGLSDGTATVKASGGTANYSYRWNSSPVQNTATASNLSQGTYTCTVTDEHGCTTTQQVLITEPAALTGTIVSQQNVFCKGDSTGTATVAGNGGTPAYNYHWDTNPQQNTATATGLAVGTYNCTITDFNQCSTVQSVTITEPANGISPSILYQKDTRCKENDSTGLAMVNATGGTGSYSYSWNTKPIQTSALATNLSARDYICKISDASGCSVKQLVTIKEKFPLKAAIQSQQNVGCYGDSTGQATVVASEGLGEYLYTWNTNPIQVGSTATNLPEGVYVCTVMDASTCSTTQEVKIMQPSKLLTIVTSKKDAICAANGEIRVQSSGGTPPYSYTWDTSPAQTDSTAIGLSVGTYTCTVTDFSNCIALTLPTSIAQQTSYQSRQDVQLCEGQELHMGSNTYTQSGTYTDVFTAGNGCDSIVTTNLEVTRINRTVTKTGNTLTADETNASYQWTDCATNTPISGATQQSFDPQKTGRYAVQIEKENCKENSDCYEVVIAATGVIANDKRYSLQIYPNPNTGICTMKGLFSGKLFLYNELGILAKTIELQADVVKELDIQDLSPGIYYVKGIGIQQQKLVIVH